MIGIIVFEHKACSLEYFLDKMQIWELDLIMDKLNLCLKNDWEMTREIVWSELACHSKKKIKPTDVYQFSWDKKTDKKAQFLSRKVTKKDVEAAKAKAERRKEILMKQGIL